MAERQHGGLTCAEAADLAPGFVLGSLEPDEAAAVREHLAECPEAHTEFEELESMVPALLESVSLVDPPADLRARVLQTASLGQPAPLVDATPRSGAAPSAPVEALAPPQPGNVRQLGPFFGRRESGLPGRLSLGLRIAAVLAIVTLGAWNLGLQQQLGAANRYADAVAATLDIAARSGSATAVLAPSTPGGPSGLAAIAADGSVAVAVRGLNATNGREVYVAWTIIGSGAPVPMGSFTVGADGHGALAARGQPAKSSTIIALTREPAPGATTPTLPIVLSGSAVVTAA